MKTINLYFDFEFTSLSPDAQPISLGIVSDDLMPVDFPNEYPNADNADWVPTNDYKSKSFYAEFSDFDLNRCDDWVKENVVKKLWMDYGHNTVFYDDNRWDSYGSFDYNKQMLEGYLEQFSDYQIQFVKDVKSTNGTGLDWLTLVELLRIDNPLSDYCFIDLTKGYKAIIDINKYKEVSKHSWCAHETAKKCYPETRIKGKLIRLHQFLMGKKPFENAIIDHINGNSLDNRKSNLRWTTIKQNNHNTSSRKSTSKYKGVRWHDKLNKWSAFISKGGKYFHLGMFKNESDAAKKYNKKAKEFFGEYCKLNEFDYLPKLPSNISPIPQDLNDLIAIKKGISVREAFDMDRLKLIDVNGILESIHNIYDAQDKLEESYPELKEGWENTPDTNLYRKHNALLDAKVIKATYEKLK